MLPTVFAIAGIFLAALDPHQENAPPQEPARPAPDVGARLRVEADRLKNGCASEFFAALIKASQPGNREGLTNEVPEMIKQEDQTTRDALQVPALIKQVDQVTRDVLRFGLARAQAPGSGPPALQEWLDLKARIVGHAEAIVLEALLRPGQARRWSVRASRPVMPSLPGRYSAIPIDYPDGTTPAAYTRAEYYDVLVQQQYGLRASELFGILLSYRPSRPFPGQAPQLRDLLASGGCDLRLMSPVDDVSGIPKVGKRLLIVVVADRVLHFRVFDGDGRIAVDSDAEGLADEARPIEQFRKQLESLWPPHELTKNEKDRLIATAASIVGHTLPGLTPEQLELLERVDQLARNASRYWFVRDVEPPPGWRDPDPKGVRELPPTPAMELRLSNRGQRIRASIVDHAESMALSAVLTPEQAEQTKLELWRRRGVHALLDPELAGRLSMSKAQRADLAERLKERLEVYHNMIRTGVVEFRGRTRSDIDALRKQRKEELAQRLSALDQPIWEILQPSQLRALARLLDKPVGGHTPSNPKPKPKRAGRAA